MIGLRAEKAAYFLADATLPFYVEFEFDANSLAGLLERAGVKHTTFKREMLLLKMFVVRRGLEARVPPERVKTMWALYLGQMERILDMLFPRHKDEIKEGLASALASYAEACPGVSEGMAACAGKHLARRLGLEHEPRLASYAANVFGRKTDRLVRLLARRIRY